MTTKQIERVSLFEPLTQEEISELAYASREVISELPSTEDLYKHVKEPDTLTLIIEGCRIFKALATADQADGLDIDETEALVVRSLQLATTLDIACDDGALAGECTQAARDDRKECREECKKNGKKVCGCVAKWFKALVGCFTP